MKNLKHLISRRQFLGQIAVGTAGLVLLPSLAIGRKQAPKSDVLKLGFIGLGQQAMSLLNGFIGISGVEVIAGCDVYGVKRLRFEKRVKDYYKKRDKDATVQLYEKFEDLIANKDIDVVVIATPDHTHALIAIAACKAKKHVYLEKPMTFTITEGQKLVKAVRSNKVVLAVGSQQRSDLNFQHAVKMVQGGKIGKIERVNAYVGNPVAPIPYNLPEQPVPAGLNWDLWQKPLPYKVHYNEALALPISIDPERNEREWGAWRWYKETGGGYATDWGAHMYDIVQWGLGMDKSGPVEIIPQGYEGAKFITYKYANGVVLTSEPYNEAKTQGVKFWGTEGWLEVSREHFKSSDESLNPPKVQAQNDAPYETKVPHYANFIDAVRTGTDPIVPVETGHRTCTVCTLGNIACDLNRPIKWNPVTEKIIGDKEAAKHMLMSY